MMRAEADKTHPDWRTISYLPGDVLLFGSLTAHGAMPNRTDRLRVSADFRYQAVSSPMARDALGTGKPHYHPDVPDFPTRTRGWTSTRSVGIPAGVRFVERWDRGWTTYRSLHRVSGTTRPDRRTDGRCRPGPGPAGRGR